MGTPMISGYRTTYEGTLLRGTVLDAPDLARRIAERRALDYEKYAPGSSTVVAEMRWREDGSVLFEGLTGEHALTPSGEADFPGRVAAHWEGFTEAQCRRHEADLEARGRRPKGRVIRTSYVHMGVLHVVPDRTRLREELRRRTDLDLGEHSPDGRTVVTFARLRWQPDGSVVVAGKSGTRTMPRGSDIDLVADEWNYLVAKDTAIRCGRDGGESAGAA